MVRSDWRSIGNCLHFGLPSHGSGWVGLNKKDRVKVHVYPDSQGVRLVVLAEDIAKLGVGDFNLCAHGAGWKLIGVVHIRNSYHEGGALMAKRKVC